MKCAYCGQERPTEELKQGTITVRVREWDPWKGKYVSTVEKRTKHYCKDKNCHANDQMAHEG